MFHICCCTSMPIDRSRSEKFISRALVKRKTVESLARKYSQLSREAWSLILPHFAYLPVGKTCLMWAPRYNCVWSAALFFLLLSFLSSSLCFLLSLAHRRSLLVHQARFHISMPISVTALSRARLSVLELKICKQGKFRKWKHSQAWNSLFHFSRAHARLSANFVIFFHLLQRSQLCVVSLARQLERVNKFSPLFFM